MREQEVNENVDPKEEGVRLKGRRVSDWRSDLRA